MIRSPVSVPTSPPADATLEILQALQRTYQPSVLRRKRRHGFLKRNASVGGRKVLQRRRERGRKTLV